METDRAGARRRPRLPLAPGPAGGVPLFGQVFEAWRDPLRLFMRCRAEHGDVVRLKLGHLRFHLVSDPAGIKHVLVDNARAYRKSRNYRGLKLVLGNGLFTSEGDYWRRQRRAAQPAFHADRLAGFAPAMAACAARMVDGWRALGDGALLDVHAELSRVALRVVARTLFAADVDDRGGALGAAATVALQHANDYNRAMLPVPPWIPTPRNVRFRRALRALDRLALAIIAGRRSNPGEPGDLLSLFMAVRDPETGEGLTDAQLRDEVLTMILAGFETTAATLTWTLYLLGANPPVERRLVAEVQEVLGARAPGVSDLPRLPFTRMVIAESLRLYPPGWAFDREALEPDEICGYAIAPGDIVGISPWVVHRHPDHWPDPERFDPDRFASGDSDGRPRHAYLPFGAGPRACIGGGFAMMEAQILLAAIVQGVRLSLVPGHPVEVSPLITLRPRHGILMRAARRPPPGAPPPSGGGPGDRLGHGAP